MEARQDVLWEDPVLKAAAAAMSAIFGIVVIMGGPRRAPNLFLGVFLLLISGNQAAEVLRNLAADPAGALRWYRVATVFAALDPFFLYYFASIFPRRNRLNAAPAVVAVFLVGGALALWGLSIRPGLGEDPWSDWHRLAWSAYTAVVYTAALSQVLAGLVRRDDPRAHLFLPAMCVAAIPTWPRAVQLVQPVLEGGRAVSTLTTTATAVAVVVPTAAVILVTWRATAIPDHVSRQAWYGALAGGALALTMNASALYGVMRDVGLISFRTPFWALTSVRWLVFAWLVSVALLRHDMLGMSLTARRRAARAVVAAVVGTGAVALLAWWSVDDAGRFEVRPLDAIVVLVALAATQVWRHVVDRVGARLYGVPARGDLAATLSAYQHAARQAHEEGRGLDDPTLVRLRDELGLDARTAAVVEGMVAAGPTGPVAPGTRVGGRYVVLGTLGRGTSGRALLCHDEVLARDVVLKEVSHDHAGAARRALSEARLAGSLAHANVVTVHDVVHHTGVSFVVTEHVAGGTLADRLERGRPGLDEGLALLDGILSGLAAAHAHGVIHRDVKPANVLLTPDGYPKVADFGTAAVDDGGTVQAEGLTGYVGTPRFMAPEQRRGDPATPSTDVYAVGLLARHALPKDVPLSVEDVVVRALAEDPAARWPDAEAMRTALHAAVSGGT